MSNSFTEFKTNFYSRIDDFTLFDCDEVNLLKVVLDGLKVNYSLRGKVRSSVFYPTFIYNIFLLLKRTFHRTGNQKIIETFISESKGKEILLHDIGRFTKGDKPKSVYFNRITNELPEDKILEIFDSHYLTEKLLTKKILNHYQNLSLSKEEKQLRQQLINTYKKINKAALFNKQELRNIKFAIHKFFQDYKAWSRLLLEIKSIKQCILICHYHKEGQILALKRNNIKVIELQHGLIAEQDIFYVLPKTAETVINRSLFADEIWIYGEYWKSVLEKGCEYKTPNIKVIGYYHNLQLNSNLTDLYKLIKDRHPVIVTTQTFLHGQYIEIVNYLLKNSKLFGHDDILILLKPHPFEDENIYQEAFAVNKNVQVVTYPIENIFEVCKTHVSIYSTTLFDALRHGVSNYVVEVPECKDYSDAILKIGIADKINMETNQMEVYRTNFDTSYFYKEFNPEILRGSHSSINFKSI